MRMVGRMALALAALGASAAGAGTVTFAGASEFSFTGYNNGAQDVLRVCARWSACHTAYGDAQVEQVLSSSFNRVEAGSAVRGSLEDADPQGKLAYHSMEFELHTKDFFSKNPQAHIVVAPRTFLPFVRPDPQLGEVAYHGYPEFQVWPGSRPALKVPHAYGNGVILGYVPCTNGLTRLPSPQSAYVAGTGTVAIEHFLGPASTDPASMVPSESANRTACPVVQTVNGAPTAQNAIATFEDHAVYSVKVFVRQFACPGSTATCRTVGYTIQQLLPALGPVAKGGGDESSFVDQSADAPSWGGPPRGWSALRPADRSSWFLSHILTDPMGPSQSWEFQVKKFQVSAGHTAPDWW